jgi:DNA-binding response OmpR family regulator
MYQNTSVDLPKISQAMGLDLDSISVMDKPRVLIVDDDPDYISMLKIILRRADFDVSGVLDHQAALEKCGELNPDVILLDLMMPEVDGYGIFEMLRKVTNAPVIFISAAHRPEHLSRTLEMGAEDYISKPFDNTEIIARIKKVLRQTRENEPLRVHFFPELDLRIDLDAHDVHLRGKPIRLLPREFTLLTILAEHAPRNVPYEKITQMIWGKDTDRTRAHLKTIAFGLRQKIETDPARPEILVNNRSVGYQLVTIS